MVKLDFLNRNKSGNRNKLFIKCSATLTFDLKVRPPVIYQTDLVCDLMTSQINKLAYTLFIIIHRYMEVRVLVRNSRTTRFMKT